MLSLGVQQADDFSQRRNRSYFVWEFGKVLEVCIEVVSNSEGDELILSQKSRQKGKTISKKEIYAQIGVRYYGVFDPLQQIQGHDEMNGALLRVWSISPDGYPELTPPEGIAVVNLVRTFWWGRGAPPPKCPCLNQSEYSNITVPGQPIWLPTVGLSLTLWEGQFEEDVTRLWLRWCDQAGQVIPTGAERAERLAHRLRALGIDPDQV